MGLNLTFVVVTNQNPVLNVVITPAKSGDDAVVSALLTHRILNLAMVYHDLLYLNYLLTWNLLSSNYLELPDGQS